MAIKKKQESTSEAIKDIKTMISSFHSLMVVETVEEERVRELFGKASMELSIPFYEWSISEGLKCSDLINPLLSLDPAAVITQIQQVKGEGVFLLKDFVQHLTYPKIIRDLRELTQKLSRSRSMIVLVAPTIALPLELEHSAIHYTVHMPTREQLKTVVVNVLNELAAHRGQKPIKINLSPSEGDNLLNAMMGMTMKQARQAIAYCLMDDQVLDASDIPKVMERKAQAIRDGGVLDFYPAESNAYELGGFEKLKQYLNQAQVAYSSEAESLGISPPKGILIVGVPGCGKSLAVKVIAKQWGMPLLKLDAGKLFDKYMGESEKNFRKAILSAEAMSPTVLWIDEIEKMLSMNGGNDSEGGVSQRIFGTFLTWLQEKEKPVFVVATANDISGVPPELFRKGRFDEVFFVDLPDGKERREIFSIHLRLRKQNVEGIDLSALAVASEGFSGAEIEQVVTTAVLVGLRKKTVVGTELVLSQIASTIPLSVSRREEIASLRALGQKQFVSVK